jgi:hypothetical protein
LEYGALTWICTTSFRLRKAACRTNYTLRANGTVIGLAPIWLPRPCKSDAHKKRPLREEQWPDLKSRLREWWLCANTFAFTDYLRRVNKMVPEVGIAPTSPRLQRGANLPQLLGVKLKEALRFQSASSLFID